jgi:hypothetical protein
MLDIDGDFEQLIKKLSRIDDPRLRQLIAIRLRTELHNRIAPYPPGTEANRAAPGKTHYQRGYGSVYTRKSDGRRTSRRTSQMAGRKWRMGELVGGATLKNTASYSIYLHDKEHQPPYHARRGWQTWQEGLQKMQRGGDIEEIFQDTFLRWMR